jgi:hypothetical protein
MKAGDIVDRLQANTLPDGSQIRRVDGKGDYAPLTRHKGLWKKGSQGDPAGIGTADWLILKVGGSELRRRE